MWESCIKGENHLNEKVHLIFPLAQVEVNNFIKDLKNKGAKGRVYVFGSAITSHMNPWSDIDIAFDTDKRPEYYSKEYAIDLIDLKDPDYINNPIYEEIMKGVHFDL